MGEYLHGQGHTVMGIRLAGHATCPKDMVRTRWHDWMNSIEDGWHLLREVTDHVFLIGLSLGGSLSLLYASQYPIQGVVALSTPYNLPNDPRLPFVEWISWLTPNVAKGPTDWHNPKAAEDHIEYPAYPTRSIAELRDVIKEMRAALPRIRVPVMLIHSRQDGSVPIEHMNKIFNALGTTDKQMVLVEHSGHVITREPDRQVVFQAALDFILRVTGK